jgi:cytochrome c peroxidase
MSLDGAIHDTDSADSGAQLPITTDEHDAAPGGYAHESEAGATPTDFAWDLPTGFPLPVVPPDNPMSAAKVELGRRLFYDTQLSGNQTQSCGSCHRQALAFTDGRATSVGSTGQLHPRGALSLANVAYASSLTWANPLFAMAVLPEPLERQSQLPLYGDAPVELGLKSQSQIEGRLRAASDYPGWFARAFPDQEQPITAQNIGRALAAFERTLISGNSAFDRFMVGRDASALSDAAVRGYALFSSDRLGCAVCHAGFDLSDHVHYRDKPSLEQPYHNTALYNLDGHGAYPEPNTGTYNVTQDPKDMGHFKAPSLRNIAVTAPYMHDGSIATLSLVLDHYAAGGRTLSSGMYAGVGAENPLKDPLLHGFTLTESERADLLEFLESLTDRTFLADPRFADPFR